ncbi:hypothetical protein [Sorangium sp. So ce1389]|uniref:hypothetical protein n=1 Tax=Sorangium sp. So ce1389 TaxID=3133336 RepID=UPI003F62C408
MNGRLTQFVGVVRVVSASVAAGAAHAPLAARARLARRWLPARGSRADGFAHHESLAGLADARI